MKEPYWRHMLNCWDRKTWIDNEDFRIETHGSPKFTSRVSDMRKKGVEIEGIRAISGYFKYRLITNKKDVIRIMTKRKKKTT